jgi:concentrative nucleoside transporter, CNT family
LPGISGQTTAGGMSQLARGILGVVTLLLIAWLLSERRRVVSWRFVGLGVLVQVLLAALLLKLPVTTTVFAQVNRAVIGVQEASQAGSTFVFGFLGGGPAPYEPSGTGSEIVLAFRFCL